MLYHSLLQNKTFNIVIGIGAVLIGGLFYLTFRTESLVMFDWFDKLGCAAPIHILRETYGGVSIYAWIKYNLPAALWLFSYMFIIRGIWLNQNPILYRLFLYAIPFMAIASEILQYFSLIPGTFDIKDLIAYVLGIVLFRIITIHKI